ncbi:hypothetical protein LB505_001009 [Fusarium chuoi]|nr:hypothetical protein LB503_003855 [Fusarium chuoi]KAI1042868.1 hypothetical protein LB505_001009 [Fusarium chuoi]
MDQETGSSSTSANQKVPANSNQQDESREETDRKRNNIRKRTKTGCLSRYATTVSNPSAIARATTNVLSSRTLWVRYKEALLDLLITLLDLLTLPLTYKRRPLRAHYP